MAARPTTRVSVKDAQREQRTEERRLSKAWVAQAKKNGVPVTSGLSVATADSFQNFLLGMGMGTDNGNSANSYGFNPITRNRILCEWIYRGSWVGGVAVDVVANDMTRAGIEHPNGMEPEDIGALDRAAARLNVWQSINETIRWGRLYGGAISVIMIDGQDPSTPLRLETVGKDQFKGLLTLDRWMVEPSLQDLVTDMGPHIGLPKFYRVTQAAPAMRGQRVHHTRVAIRHCGISLPYNQRLAENLWGLSVYERLYDRLTAFDMATTGAAQLVNKCYIRTMKVKDLRSLVAAGGTPFAGLLSFMSFVRRTQGIEGITLLDAEDEYESESHQAFSGLDAIVMQFASQIAGALQVPLVRLMGQSPGGLNATGDGDERIYYDNIAQAQTNELFHGVQLVYQLLSASEGVKLPDDFKVAFASLAQLSDVDKAAVAEKDVATVTAALDSALISDQVALQELQQLSRRTGRFTNITQEMIDAAEDVPAPEPSPLELMDYQAQLDQQSRKDDAANDDRIPGEKNGKTDRQPNGGGQRKSFATA